MKKEYELSELLNEFYIDEESILRSHKKVQNSFKKNVLLEKYEVLEKVSFVKKHINDIMKNFNLDYYNKKYYDETRILIKALSKLNYKILVDTPVDLLLLLKNKEDQISVKLTTSSISKKYGEFDVDFLLSDLDTNLVYKFIKTNVNKQIRAELIVPGSNLIQKIKEKKDSLILEVNNNIGTALIEINDYINDKSFNTVSLDKIYVLLSFLNIIQNPDLELFKKNKILQKISILKSKKDEVSNLLSSFTRKRSTNFSRIHRYNFFTNKNVLNINEICLYLKVGSFVSFSELDSNYQVMTLLKEIKEYRDKVSMILGKD